MKVNRLKAVKNVLKSIIGGDILLRLKFDKFFPYILYAFILGWFSIWLNYQAEVTMTTYEKNKEELEVLRIYHAHKTCEYAAFGRMSTVEVLLDKNGSQVQAPQKPADIIYIKER